jgi:hypothetical protein
MKTHPIHSPSFNTFYVAQYSPNWVLRVIGPMTPFAAFQMGRLLPLGKISDFGSGHKGPNNSRWITALPDKPVHLRLLNSNLESRHHGRDASSQPSSGQFTGRILSIPHETEISRFEMKILGVYAFPNNWASAEVMPVAKSKLAQRSNESELVGIPFHRGCAIQMVPFIPKEIFVASPNLIITDKSSNKKA